MTATATKPGIKDILPDMDTLREVDPQPEIQVQDNTVVFVPFKDFSGRINQTDYQFRKDIPKRIPKTEANIWLEAEKGYIK